MPRLLEGLAELCALRGRRRCREVAAGSRYGGCGALHRMAGPPGRSHGRAALAQGARQCAVWVAAVGGLDEAAPSRRAGAAHRLPVPGVPGPERPAEKTAARGSAQNHSARLLRGHQRGVGALRAGAGDPSKRRGAAGRLGATAWPGARVGGRGWRRDARTPDAGRAWLQHGRHCTRGRPAVTGGLPASDRRDRGAVLRGVGDPVGGQPAPLGEDGTRVPASAPTGRASRDRRMGQGPRWRQGQARAAALVRSPAPACGAEPDRQAVGDDRTAGRARRPRPPWLPVPGGEREDPTHRADLVEHADPYPQGVHRSCQRPDRHLEPGGARACARAAAGLRRGAAARQRGDRALPRLRRRHLARPADPQPWLGRHDRGLRDRTEHGAVAPRDGGKAAEADGQLADGPRWYGATFGSPYACRWRAGNGAVRPRLPQPSGRLGPGRADRAGLRASGRMPALPGLGDPP
ncbi:LigA [Variovorax sp. WDL1]|nr:LigA [Variovorax sp. WDL1]